jgi:hypothetical protein
MGLLALAALSGILARFDLKPPPLMAAAVASVALGVGLGLSPLGAELAGLPLWVLVGWQSFRLPLELIMHEAALEGLMPNVMSFSGKNFDILSGLSALILAICVRHFRVPRSVVAAWNVMASALLLVIIVIAVAATPLVRAFGDSELNTWVAYFPYVWLPGVMVLSAAMGHVVITRRLLAERQRSPLDRGAASPSADRFSAH